MDAHYVHRRCGEKHCLHIINNGIYYYMWDAFTRFYTLIFNKYELLLYLLFSMAVGCWLCATVIFWPMLVSYCGVLKILQNNDTNKYYTYYNIYKMILLICEKSHAVTLNKWGYFSFGTRSYAACIPQPGKHK